MERLKTFSRIARIGLATGTALGLTHEVLTSPAEAAGPCAIRVGGSVYLYTDTNNNNQYDQGELTKPEVGRKITVRVGGAQRELITDNQGAGKAVQMSGNPDSTFNGKPAVKANLAASASTGKEKSEDLLVPCQTERNKAFYFKNQEPATIPVAPRPALVVPIVTGTVRIEGGDRPIRIEKSEDWRWLPLSIVIAGAFVGLGLAAAELRRRGHHHVPAAPAQPGGAANINVPVNVTAHPIQIDLRPELRQPQAPNQP